MKNIRLETEKIKDLNVSFHRKNFQKEVVHYMNAMDVMVFPSRNEG